MLAAMAERAIRAQYVYGPTRIQRPSDGIRPLVMTKRRYGPGGAIVESGGASTWRDVAPPPVIVHAIKRCDMLNPCVTAPGRSSTTSAIDGASGELTVNVVPWSTDAGPLAICGRAMK